MNFFSWIRRKTTEAALQGFADAAAVVDDGETQDLDALRERFAAVLAPKEQAAIEPRKGRK